METKADRKSNLRPATYEALLDAGTELILEKGYNHCGLDEILKRAGAQKGSFYHFFASKEDFGLRVIDRYSKIRLASMDEYLIDPSRAPLARLRRWYESTCLRKLDQECRIGCLFGSLSQELSNQSEAIRQSLDQCLSQVRKRLTACLVEAQSAGDLRADLDAAQLAEYCLNGWEGALLRMKVVRSVEPLEIFVRVTFDLVLRPCS
ncbi:TetR family transcriptional regulator C-terminal domain-containing protein [Isosphaeraceae bacterium EP7]